MPDCESSYLPPAGDFTVAAAALATMALDDKFFCVTCPIPYVVAALMTTSGVFGVTRVRGCRALEREHADFVALPRDEQDRRIRERRASER